MPIYEYRCKKCGVTSEVLVKNASDNPDVCPKCGGTELERQISTPSSLSGSAGSSKTRCGNDVACCGSSVPCPTCPSDD